MRFGKLTVIARMENHLSPDGKTLDTQWKCVCDCGRERIARGSCLRYHRTWNCGHCEKKRMPKKHGMSYTRIHDKWLGIKTRCYNKNNAQYKDYGGRGIKVCDEWLGVNGAANFIKWAYENGWDENSALSIDRIDVNGDYEPRNCRLVDAKTQNNNKRNCIYVEYGGRRMTLKQLCEEYGLNYYTVHDRYTARGYTLEESMFTKSHGKYVRHKTCTGVKENDPR